MKSLKGTQTEKNILTAFSGESQARNRYNIFASHAFKEGYVFVRDIFNQTAAQEEQHAKTLFKFLQGGELQISGTFPAGVIKSTYDNLLESAAGEHEEYSQMYPTFSNIAMEEGFIEIGNVMNNIAVAEEYHEKRYLALAKWIKDGTMFKNSGETLWYCINCGCIVTSKDAPSACPACFHPTAWFRRLNYEW